MTKPTKDRNLVRLEQLLSIPEIEPPFIVLGGDPGTGKTSFPLHHLKGLKAAYFLAETATGVFDDLEEDKVPLTFPVAEKPSVGQPTKPYDQFMEYTSLLLKSDHDIKLFVFDTASSFEPMLVDGVCLADGVRSLGAALGGFGRGREAVNSYWQDIAERLLELRAKKKMMILVLCHTKLNKVKNSATDDEYNTNGLDLHEVAQKLFDRLSDGVFFLRMKTQIRDVETDTKTGRTTKAGKAKVYADRMLLCDASAMVGYTQAKKRYKQLPNLVTLKDGDESFQLTDYIPWFQLEENKVTK